MAEQLPILIHVMNRQLLVFDLQTVQLLRERFQICGVLSGTLFQIPQQSVFLGLPLQLMMEEAAWLVRTQDALLVDSLRAHRMTAENKTAEEKQAYREACTRREADKAEATRRAAWLARKVFLQEKKLTQVLEREEAARADWQPVTEPDKLPVQIEAASPDIFLDAAIAKTCAISLDDARLPALDERKYALYAHLHQQGYFLTPGLRFGGQFVAYPGDPLRFHSQYIASGYAWTERFPVMDIVACGRLGTTVKKDWYVGAARPENEVKAGDGKAYEGFTIQWAGM